MLPQSAQGARRLTVDQKKRGREEVDQGERYAVDVHLWVSLEPGPTKWRKRKRVRAAKALRASRSQSWEKDL
jgi:hypothetical protein